jgi:hypothetical protein
LLNVHNDVEQFDLVQIPGGFYGQVTTLLFKASFLFVVLLLVAPPSQELEPPAIPGRFNHLVQDGWMWRKNNTLVEIMQIQFHWRFSSIKQPRLHFWLLLAEKEISANVLVESIQKSWAGGENAH